MNAATAAQPGRMTALQIPEHRSRAIDDVGTSTLLDVPSGYVPGLPVIVSEDDIAELCAYMTVGETTQWHESLRQLLEEKLGLLFDIRSATEVAHDAAQYSGGGGDDDAEHLQPGLTKRTSAELRETRRRLKTVTSHPSAKNLRTTFQEHNQAENSRRGARRRASLEGIIGLRRRGISQELDQSAGRQQQASVIGTYCAVGLGI